MVTAHRHIFHLLIMVLWCITVTVHASRSPHPDDDDDIKNNQDLPAIASQLHGLKLNETLPRTQNLWTIVPFMVKDLPPIAIDRSIPGTEFYVFSVHPKKEIIFSAKVTSNQEIKCNDEKRDIEETILNKTLITLANYGISCDVPEGYERSLVLTPTQLRIHVSLPQSLPASPTKSKPSPAAADRPAPAAGWSPKALKIITDHVAGIDINALRQQFSPRAKEDEIKVDQEKKIARPPLPLPVPVPLPSRLTLADRGRLIIAPMGTPDGLAHGFPLIRHHLMRLRTADDIKTFLWDLKDHESTWRSWPFTTLHDVNRTLRTIDPMLAIDLWPHYKDSYQAIMANMFDVEYIGNEILCRWSSSNPVWGIIAISLGVAYKNPFSLLRIEEILNSWIIETPDDFPEESRTLRSNNKRLENILKYIKHDLMNIQKSIDQDIKINDVNPKESNISFLSLGTYATLTKINHRARQEDIPSFANKVNEFFEVASQQKDPRVIEYLINPKKVLTDDIINNYPTSSLSDRIRFYASLDKYRDDIDKIISKEAKKTKEDIDQLIHYAMNILKESSTPQRPNAYALNYVAETSDLTGAHGSYIHGVVAPLEKRDASFYLEKAFNYYADAGDAGDSTAYVKAMRILSIFNIKKCTKEFTKQIIDYAVELAQKQEDRYGDNSLWGRVGGFCFDINDYDRYIMYKLRGGVYDIMVAHDQMFIVAPKLFTQEQKLQIESLLKKLDLEDAKRKLFLIDLLEDTFDIVYSAASDEENMID